MIQFISILLGIARLNGSCPKIRGRESAHPLFLVSFRELCKLCFYRLSNKLHLHYTIKGGLKCACLFAASKTISQLTYKLFWHNRYRCYRVSPQSIRLRKSKINWLSSSVFYYRYLYLVVSWWKIGGQIQYSCNFIDRCR